MGITLLADQAHKQLISNTGIEPPSSVQDNELRFSIRRSAITNPNLLDTIGRAQMERALLKEILKITKQSENTAEESGVQPSVSEDDMKEYLEEVIQETKGIKSGWT
jgi:signal recognition particle GTPase